MKPIILLDIDGVLNPAMGQGDGARPKLVLTSEKIAFGSTAGRPGPDCLMEDLFLYIWLFLDPNFYLPPGWCAVGTSWNPIGALKRQFD